MPTFVHHVHRDLARLAAGGADVQQIAGHAAQIWRSVDAALSPIIGQRGVAALFRRSMLLASEAHVSLATALDDADALGGMAAFRATLERQSSAEAIATNGAVLQVFLDLLASLIGESLTDRLLQSLREGPPGGGAAREQSS